jgi:hypothetical protein
VQLNGCVIYGRSHLNASALIRSIKDENIHMVIARRMGDAALAEMAVRPEAAAVVASASSPAKLDNDDTAASSSAAEVCTGGLSVEVV